MTKDWNWIHIPNFSDIQLRDSIVDGGRPWNKLTHFVCNNRSLGIAKRHRFLYDQLSAVD